jgi:membrane protein DedA with SNARE-associated domain
VLLREHDVDRAHQWFARYGQGAVFFSRLLPVLRTFISLPAGVARMPLGRFTLYTTVGCVPWVAALTWAGYLLGSRWETLVKYFTWATIAIGLVVVAMIARAVMRRRARDKQMVPVDQSP